MFNIANIIVIFVIAIILGSAIAYILRAKKRGVKCIGCSSGGKSCGCPSAPKEDKETKEDKDASSDE